MTGEYLGILINMIFQAFLLLLKKKEVSKSWTSWSLVKFDVAWYLANTFSEQVFVWNFCIKRKINSVLFYSSLNFSWNLFFSFNQRHGAGQMGYEEQHKRTIKTIINVSAKNHPTTTSRTLRSKGLNEHYFCNLTNQLFKR